MNIYIPIEIKARELEGRTLLAIAAAERGHTVIVGEKKDTISLASSGILPPGLIHMKSITPHDSMLNLLAKLQTNNHAVTVQDEESGLLDETYDTFARLRFSKETIQSVDRVCTWGHYDARSLKKMYPDYAKKFTVTGSSRVDFWRKDFVDYYSDAEDARTLDGKPYLLIVSNFGGPLNENRFWNIMARLNEAGYFDREEGRERHEFHNAAYQTQMIGEFVLMVRQLVKTFPNHNILIRPHPVESVEGWEKLIGDVPGVFVNRNGTISRWIRHAKVIIHNGCTSALEAAIAGQKRIAYRPLPNKIEREIPNDVSIQAFTIDELINQVKAVLNDKPLHQPMSESSETEKILNDRFASISGRLAADRIVDVWDEIAESSGMESSFFGDLISRKKEPTTSMKLKLKKTLIHFRNSMTGKKGRNGNKGKLLKSSHKFPEFTDKEFETIFYSLQKNLDRFHHVKYHRFGPKSFVLHKDSNGQ